eukprot:1145142-Pyramimonas_sp.AAC.1
MATRRPGQRIEVQWGSGEAWQARIILGPCIAEDYLSVMGARAQKSAEDDDHLMMCLTPDGDVYPHCLQSPSIRSVVPFDRAGRRPVNSATGVKPGAGAQ